MSTHTASLPVINGSKFKWWFISTRPHTLTLPLVPMLLGTLLSSKTIWEINWYLAFSAIFSAIFIHIGLNFLNDSIDVERGTDTEERLGPRRGVHVGMISTKEIYIGAMLAFLISFIISLPLIWHAGLWMFMIVLSSIGCAVLYSSGPYSLSYRGWGEPFVIFYYGLVCAGATYYLQEGFISKIALLAGLQVGLFATALLAIVNLRDSEQDQVANKRTLAVRFGPRFARFEISILLTLPYVVNVLWYFWGYPMMAILPYFSLPIALNIIIRTWRYPPSKIFNKFSGETALLHLIFGCMLFIGFLVRNQ